MLDCTKCLLTKPDADFPKNAKAKSRREHGYWCRECNAKHYADNAERQRASNHRAKIKRLYGLSVDEYDALIAAGCVICSRNEGRVVMDHCHTSGKVRGALCDRCNKALGFLEDDVELIRRAADYIADHAV